MRTAFTVAMVVSLAISGLMFAGSGFNQAVGVEDRTSTLGDELEETANESRGTGDGGFDSSARSQDDGSITGFIISGTTAVVSVIWMVVLMPVTLQNIGFPVWFATPIGLAFYVFASVGAAQFASGRLFR